MGHPLVAVLEKMMSLLDSAIEYAREGFTTLPLVLDDNGFPKKAFTDSWQNLTPEDVTTLPWDRAVGIGLVLGSNSCNLAALDIDDEELARDVAAYLTRVKRSLFSWTARGRIHAFCVEEQPSKYRSINFQYKGHLAKVELRAQGSYVAAPPSPGYRWAQRDWEPLYGKIHDCWLGIVSGLGLKPVSRSAPSQRPLAGYPRPWRDEVPAGDRNQSIYEESHKLREAGMTFEDAVETLKIRFEKHYEMRGMSWTEVVRTIKSAYSKGEVQQRIGGIGLR